MKPWLDWVSLSEQFGWENNQPNLQLDITIAAVFGQRYAVRVVQLFLWETWCEAAVWLCKVARIDQGLPFPED